MREAVDPLCHAADQRDPVLRGRFADLHGNALAVFTALAGADHRQRSLFQKSEIADSVKAVRWLRYAAQQRRIIGIFLTQNSYFDACFLFAFVPHIDFFHAISSLSPHFRLGFFFKKSGILQRAC